MAWITVTTVDNIYIPDKINTRIVNTDLITHITETDDGRAVIFLAIGTDNGQRYFTAQESQAAVLAQLSSVGEKVADIGPS